MSNALADLNAQLAQRKAAAREIEQNAEQAKNLASQVESLQTDIRRYEKQHRDLVALGDGRIEMPLKTYHAAYHIEVEWQPILSLRTGTELAARVQQRIDGANAHMADLEAEVARLLDSTPAARKAGRGK